MTPYADGVRPRTPPRGARGERGPRRLHVRQVDRDESLRASGRRSRAATGPRGAPLDFALCSRPFAVAQWGTRPRDHRPARFARHASQLVPTPPSPVLITSGKRRPPIRISAWSVVPYRHLHVNRAALAKPSRVGLDREVRSRLGRGGPRSSRGSNHLVTDGGDGPAGPPRRATVRALNRTRPGRRAEEWPALRPWRERRPGGEVVKARFVARSVTARPPQRR